MSDLSIPRTEKIALLPALFKPDFQLSYQKEKLRKFQRSFTDKSLLYQTSLKRQIFKITVKTFFIFKYIKISTQLSQLAQLQLAFTIYLILVWVPEVWIISILKSSSLPTPSLSMAGRSTKIEKFSKIFEFQII